MYILIIGGFFMRIRKMKSTELDYELYLEFEKISYNNFGKNIPKWSFFLTKFDEFVEIVEEADRHWILEANNGNPIGYAQITMYPGIIIINDFFIKKEERRNKCGAKFYNYLEEKAIKRNVDEVRLIVVSKEAKMFWESLGFETFSETLFGEHMKKIV